MATFTQYLGASKSSIGVMFSVFSGCSLISTMYMPNISDNFGRRVTFLLAGFGAAVTFIGSGFVTSFPQLVVWRGLAGLFTGTVANAFAYITDIVPAAERAAHMSYMSATMSTCFVIGPMIGIYQFAVA
jgi:DHA1 family tetracycline resistance protein-like MFS transporter